DAPDSPMMPVKREEWLTAGQIEAVERWIRNGALQYRLPSQCDNRPVMETDFPSAKECGACHPRQFEQWSRSMHAYAQHSPVFEAFNLTLVERTGGTIGTFCSRCHTPIGTALGENASRRNVNRSRISMEGISCVVCHRRKDGRYKSSGRISFEPGGVAEGCVYGPFDATAPAGSQTHPSVKLSYIKTSQFCGECHDVFSPSGVRLEEAFSEWHNSPAAKQGVTCQHCHMGPVQGRPFADEQRPLGPAAVVPGAPPGSMPLRHLADHTFAGPDYSMLPDTEWPEKLDWMYEVDYRDTSRLTPYQQRTLYELRLRNRRQLAIARANRYEVLSNAADLHVSHPQSAAAGDKVKIHVDIESVFTGHSFPTGFTAERQVWVQIEVRDALGKLVFASGDLDHNGDLRDDHSHDVLMGKMRHDHYLLNLQNKFIALGNKGTERSVILSVNRNVAPISVFRPATGIAASFGRPVGFRLAKGALAPLRSAGRTYVVDLPDCGGQYTVVVRLNFRHLPPTLFDSIGIPHLKHLLEIVVLREYVGTISTGSGIHPSWKLTLPTNQPRGRAESFSAPGPGGVPAPRIQRLPAPASGSVGPIRPDSNIVPPVAANDPNPTR
ncbi:MAG: multiheme c-type cytochrome, partial [Pirellulaceae bacterium]|nr:multiheme c-type cytochrome [Pirellulaceae bacterium]